MRRVLLLILLTLPAGSETVGAQEVPPSLDERLTTENSSASTFPRRIDARRLPNLIQVHEGVYSGGSPEGDQAFQELRSLGVKTVISVDGMQPDVAAARKHGLRYVHLPHGYDGVPDQRARELAKAVRTLAGPIYIHCHHGQNRSPAAASVACVAAALIPPDQSAAILKLAGTSPHYRGLYRSARAARPLAESVLDEMDVEFPETSDVPPMAEAMSSIERTHDRLALIAAAGWQAPREHPDLDPAHEALMLREHFTELLRTDFARIEPLAFRQSLQESELAARALADALTESDRRSPKQTAQRAANRLFSQISSGCTTCHQKFRDVPPSR